MSIAANSGPESRPGCDPSSVAPAANERSAAIEGSASQNDDAELRRLMIAYQNADPAAVDALVRMLSPRLYRFLAAPGGLAGDTDDLLQECWMRVHRARHTYRAAEPVLPWIYSIARHTKLDGFRRHKRRGSREVLYGEVPEPKAASDDQAAFDGGERLNAMLAVLPESQREVIVMLKVTGMSLEEVARATSTTVGSVKQRAHRAYEKLRVLLKAEEA